MRYSSKCGSAVHSAWRERESDCEPVAGHFGIWHAYCRRL